MDVVTEHANPTRTEPTPLEPGPEVVGSRGGIRVYRKMPDGSTGGSQFTGRTLPPAIHRPEERYP